MSDFFKKLNTLIQASVNDVLSDAQKSVSEPLKYIPRQRLGQGIENEVDKLREQVNSALAYEDELVKRVQELELEVTQLDRDADTAVANGEDDQARYLIERLNRAKQRLTMTQSDLNEHRIVTQDLIMRVNQLDATIADARHREAEASEAPTESAEPSNTRATSQSPSETVSRATDAGLEQARALSEQANRVLSDVLREAREKMSEMGTMVENAQSSAQAPVEPSVAEQVDEEISKAAVEDDLASRLARLSKPKPADPNPDSPQKGSQ